MTTTEAKAVEQAFVRYRLDIYRFLLRRMRNHHDAEDLTQQVFADAAAAIPRAGTPRSMRGWLYAVAERRLVDELRRRDRDARTARLLAAERDVACGEPGHAVDEALAQLPERQRQVVVLRIVEDHAYPVIARLLDCNEGACKMRLSRALHQLRHELGIAS